MPITLAKCCRTCTNFQQMTSHFGTCTINYQLRVGLTFVCQENYKPDPKIDITKELYSNPRSAGWKQSFNRAKRDTKRQERQRVFSLQREANSLAWLSKHPEPSANNSKARTRWYAARATFEHSELYYPTKTVETEIALKAYMKAFTAKYLLDHPRPPDLLQVEDSHNRFMESVDDD